MNAAKCQMNRYLRASSKQLNLAVWKILRKYQKMFAFFGFFLLCACMSEGSPPLGRRQCETNKISACSKTLQNHHSTASTTADPVRAFANHPIVKREKNAPTLSRAGVRSSNLRLTQVNSAFLKRAACTPSPLTISWGPCPSVSRPWLAQMPILINNLNPM